MPRSRKKIIQQLVRKLSKIPQGAGSANKNDMVNILKKINGPFRQQYILPVKSGRRIELRIQKGLHI
jgi:hypothetical protein